MKQAMRRVCWQLIFVMILLPACSVMMHNDCWRQSHDAYAQTTLSVTKALDNEIDDYKRLVEETLSHRAKAIRVARHLKERIHAGKPLSGADLDTLNQGMLKHMGIRDRFYAVARRHECWVAASREDYRRAGLEDVSPEDQLKGVMISLSAALMLYDNYMLLTSIFVEDPKLRRFLNQRDSGYDIGLRKLDEVTMSYTSVAKRERVRRAMRFYEKQLGEPPISQSQNARFLYLRALIEQSPSYAMTRGYSPVFVIGQKLKFMGAITLDSLTELEESGLTLFSSVFGNSIGLVETRRGKLYHRREVKRALQHELQAGDILLEKTPFRLTDHFIPGYWGHAAVWVGTAAELKALGLWDHPVVAPYRGAVQQGRSMVEVLLDGVQLNTLEDFLNTDSLVLIRHTGLDPQELGERVVVALRQVGKEYDFTFDIETTDRMCCTELIYSVHADIDWPSARVLGHHTISPDHIALQALQGSPLRLITMYHDGELIREGRRELMEELLGTVSAEPGRHATGGSLESVENAP